MHIYISQIRYNQKTGNPDGNFVVKSKDVICDYTGELLAYDEIEPLWYTISINYDHSSEPMWYEEKLRIELEDNYGVEYSEFSSLMESPYHFKLNDDYTDASLDMLKEWMGNPKMKHRNVEEIFRITRLKTLKKLLSGSKFVVTDLIFQR